MTYLASRHSSSQIKLRICPSQSYIALEISIEIICVKTTMRKSEEYIEDIRIQVVTLRKSGLSLEAILKQVLVFRSSVQYIISE